MVYCVLIADFDTLKAHVLPVHFMNSIHLVDILCFSQYLCVTPYTSLFYCITREIFN